MSRNTGSGRLPRWVSLVLGLASTALGLYVVVRPFSSLSLLVLLVAIGLIVIGIARLIGAGDDGSILTRVIGAAWIAVGIGAIVWPNVTVGGLTLLVVVWLIVDGLADAAAGLRRPPTSGRRPHQGRGHDRVRDPRPDLAGYHGARHRRRVRRPASDLRRYPGSGGVPRPRSREVRGRTRGSRSVCGVAATSPAPSSRSWRHSLSWASARTCGPGSGHSALHPRRRGPGRRRPGTGKRPAPACRPSPQRDRGEHPHHPDGHGVRRRLPRRLSDDYVVPSGRVTLTEVAERCLGEPAVFASILSSLAVDWSLVTQDLTTGPLTERLAENTPPLPSKLLSWSVREPPTCWCSRPHKTGTWPISTPAGEPSTTERTRPRPRSAGGAGFTAHPRPRRLDRRPPRRRATALHVPGWVGEARRFVGHTSRHLTTSARRVGPFGTGTWSSADETMRHSRARSVSTNRRERSAHVDRDPT